MVKKDHFFLMRGDPDDFYLGVLIRRYPSHEEARRYGQAYMEDNPQGQGLIMTLGYESRPTPIERWDERAIYPKPWDGTRILKSGWRNLETRELDVVKEVLQREDGMDLFGSPNWVEVK